MDQNGKIVSIPYKHSQTPFNKKYINIAMAYNLNWHTYLFIHYMECLFYRQFNIHNGDLQIYNIIQSIITRHKQLLERLYIHTLLEEGMMSYMVCDDNSLDTQSRETCITASEVRSMGSAGMWVGSEAWLTPKKLHKLKGHEYFNILMSFDKKQKLGQRLLIR